VFDVGVTKQVGGMAGRRETGEVMKVIVMLKGAGADESKIASTREMAAMGDYNERLVKAGIVLDGAGLKPSSEGVQLVFEGGTTSVVDGPFTEAKEIIAGYWIWQVNSVEEAVEWAKQCPIDPRGLRRLLEIRPYDDEDFGEEDTPALRERDARLSEEIRAQHGKG
jgi:hypothetical protein